MSTPVSNSKSVSNTDKDEQKNESAYLNNNEQNGHTVEDKTQKITKVSNGTSTSIMTVQVVIKQNEQYGTQIEDKNQNIKEIRDDEEPKKPTLPKTNGNGKVNGKHNSKPNSIDQKSKKREMESSDDLTLNNTTRKTRRLLQS